MTDIPRRFKELSELSVDEQLTIEQAQRKGQRVPKFETPEYREARNQALRDAASRRTKTRSPSRSRR